MHTKNAAIIESKSSLYDVQKIRNDFPILKLKVHGKQLVYLNQK